MSGGSSKCFHISLFSVVFFLLLFCSSFVISQEPGCCEQVSGSCSSACKQLSLVTLASELTSQNGDIFRSKHLRPVQLLCPSQLTTFWECMNETLDALRAGANWEGRFCCQIARTGLCQISCLTAQETSDLDNGCRRSDESPLYQCLGKQEEIESCCTQSNKLECISLCRNILRESPGTSESNSQRRSSISSIRKKLNAVCERESNIVQCVQNLTQTKPVHNAEKFLPCCSKGRSFECQEACKRALKSHSTSDSTLLEKLTAKGCGLPTPEDQMWQCFLQNVEPVGGNAEVPPSKIDRLGMDAAKLHCCHRAKSPPCRRLCYKTYSREWTGSWSDLDNACLSSPTEMSLRACVDEVEEPCQLGCSGLNFCSSFTNRPNELFRRCNPIADLSAQEQYQQWNSLGYISLSPTVRLPLKNISSCAPEKWKSVACALQLKPCHPKNHASQICRSDCSSLLHQCVDFEHFLMLGGMSHDINSICELLSPPLGEPCISLSPYANPSKQLREKVNRRDSQSERITRPCLGNPCNNNQTTTEICHINRDCYGRRNCPSFQCSAGCSLGEVSRLTVAPGTWLRVPGPGCHRLCKCSEDGLIEQCSQQACESPSPCWFNRNRIEHGSNFWIDCNLCSCRFGEMSCSKHHCTKLSTSNEIGFESLVDSQDSESEIDGGLPCNCNPKIRSPVCGTNGKTYFSPCMARCAGLSDSNFVSGGCEIKEPCDGVFCGENRRCIPSRKTCLIPSSRRCQQFQCVPIKCDDTSSEPVCDTSGRQHDSLCSLLNSGALLAYKGRCLKSISGCSDVGTICGVDGTTYTSECIAEAVGIPKDYSGPCRFIGISDGTKIEYSCKQDVICPTLPSHCSGVTPPGACCPVCGGIIQVIYSASQVTKLAEATDSKSLTIEDITTKLNLLVQTLECRVGAYLGIGNEIIVIVRPILRNWSKLQMQACVSEAERIGTMISHQNPILQVDASLSLLTGASISHITSGGRSTTQPIQTSFYCIISISILFYVISDVIR